MDITTIRSAAKKMLIDFEETKRLEHNPTKGRAREYSVIENFLRPYLPHRYSIGSGIIIDIYGKQSKQQDLIIYDGWSSPLLRDLDSEKIIFPESVFAAIEVKSSMGRKELADMAAKAISIGEMSIAIDPIMAVSPGLAITPNRVQPLCAGIALSSSLRISELPEIMRDVRNSQESAYNLAIVCVLRDKDERAGLLVSVEENRVNMITTMPNKQSRLAYIVCDSSGDALLYFYLALMKHLSSSGAIIPTPDLLAYASAAGAGWPSHQMEPAEMRGAFAEIEGKQVNLDALQELRLLVVERQKRKLSDEENLQMFYLMSQAPGFETMTDPEAVFVDSNNILDLPRPTEFLDAVLRHLDKTPANGDDILLRKLVDFMDSWRGRTVVVMNPRTLQSFEIRSGAGDREDIQKGMRVGNGNIRPQ